MAPIVYILCAFTSLACAFMLMRAYKRHRTSILLWSAVCFICLALNNSLLFIDLVLTPHVDLYLLRNSFSFTGVMALLYGMIRETV